MHGTIPSATTKKQHRPGLLGYLARPRIGAVRSIYSTKPLETTTTRSVDGHTKMKYRKTSDGAYSKMDQLYSNIVGNKHRSDPVDTAYREAVGRLKVLLAESYTTTTTKVSAGKQRMLRYESGDDTDNQSVLSSRSRHSHHHPPIPSGGLYSSKRYPPYYSRSHMTPALAKGLLHSTNETKNQFAEKPIMPPEMMSFIDRQEDYIEQLEREAQFSRDELASLLEKVKQVISENENLHEKQKSTIMKSVMDQLGTETETDAELDLRKSLRKSPKAQKRRLEGPSIVFESKISELEAQLTQTKIEFKKCREENDNYKQQIADGTLTDQITFAHCSQVQLEKLQREKANLQEHIAKLQSEIAALRDHNSETSTKIKRSLDVVEQAQFEKTHLETEVRRLTDELDRQHEKLRETMHEQCRRLADERTALERRYQQQIEQLQTERNVQWEQASKLQLDLEKQRWSESEARRDAAQKQSQIDELKKELHTKTSMLQSDLAASGAERDALQQQIASLQLSVERAERAAKQETSRLQAEVQSLRQRLDRADADVLHSRRENLRLTEQIASLEKERAVNALAGTEKPLVPAETEADARDTHLATMIQDMESKHVATVAELEGMIHSQNQLMEKLTNECHSLTQKLEDAALRHKKEIRQLQTNIDYLTNSFKQQQQQQQLSHVVQSSPNQDAQEINVSQYQAPLVSQSRRNSIALNRTSSTASILGNTAAKEPIAERAEYGNGGEHLDQQPGQQYAVDEYYLPEQQEYETDSDQQYAPYPIDPNYELDDQQQYAMDQYYHNNQNQEEHEQPPAPA